MYLPELDLAAYQRPRPPGLGRRRLRRLLFVTMLIAVFAGSAHVAEVDMARLVRNLPKMGLWLAQMFPPYEFRAPPTSQEMGYYLRSALETVAIATVGTGAAAVLALVPAVLATRWLTPSLLLFYPIRWFLNSLRAIDSFIFALYFVAAVGLGPFAGVLGVALHTWGSMAKLYAEALENVNFGPVEAVAATGAGRVKTIVYALTPDVMPSLASVTLYFWEFNVRASIALGIIGAGGIGQDIKNAMDLLNFPHLAALIVIVLVMVTIIDQLSAVMRQALR
jgi:phosphonate transport system permease protein